MLLAAVSSLLLYAQAAQAQGSATYYLVFLRPDPARQSLPAAGAQRLQSAHMDNIRGMAARGVLAAAGPFDDTPHAISGLFVLKAASLEAARKIAAEDPTVAAHRNTVDAHIWLGPQGIGEEYMRLHKENPQTAEGMGVQPFCLLLRGPAWDSGRRGSGLAAHAAYVARLRAAGKLAAGGDIENDPRYVAVEIFKRLPPDDARRLLEDSPAIESGILRAEYHSWWCAEHVLPW